MVSEFHFTVEAALYTLPFATGIALGERRRRMHRAEGVAKGQVTPALQAAMDAGTAEWRRLHEEYEIVAGEVAGEAAETP